MCLRHYESSVLQDNAEKIKRKSKRHSIRRSTQFIRPDRYCIDYLFTIQQLIQKTIQTNDEIHIPFIDFKNIYDNVDSSRLRTTLRTILKLYELQPHRNIAEI